MSTAARKPRLFIASSTESLRVAYNVQESLEYGVHPPIAHMARRWETGA